MKKVIITSLLALLCPLISSAQTDTVFGKSPRYHYSEWYDTLPDFFNHPDYGPKFGYFYPGGATAPQFTWPNAKEQFSRDSIAVKGIAITAGMDSPFHDTFFHHPEYLLLGHYDSINHTMTYISDSLRWDTVKPKIYQYDRCIHTNDSHSHYNFPLYEVFFPKGPVIVDSSFFIIFSNNNYFHDPDNGPAVIFYGITGDLHALGYDLIKMRELRSYYNDDSSLYWYQRLITNEETGATYYKNYYWGCVFPIVDYYNLVARPDDSCSHMGYVSGSGRFSDYVTRRITAHPYHGFVFSHWNDGVSFNPRPLILSSDTLFTAFFRPANPCRAVVSSADPSRGSVSGSGVYLELDTVSISASPSTGFAFSHWNDGVTDNPRSFVISHDTAFSAFFRHLESFHVDVATNDHARGYVTGAGDYLEFDTAVLRAIPRPGFVFHSWNDGISDNPRRIVVTSDTAFSAHFYNPEAIPSSHSDTPLLSLSPNPADNSVSISLSDRIPNPGNCSLSLLDAAGHELFSLRPPSHSFLLRTDSLPAGTYFLSLLSPLGSHSLRLVISHNSN